MASWDDEDFDDAVPSVPSNGLKLTDKWEGEDEEVADAWDAEEEEKPATATDASDAQKKRRKNLKEIIKEKEEKRLEELAKKKQEALAAAEECAAMTPEAIRRAQEESDLLLAKETFGCTDPQPSNIEKDRSIDLQEPRSKDDFDRLQGLLLDKLQSFEKSPHFPVFLENVFRDLSINQDAETMRKFSTMFAAMANEKMKQQRSKSKKKGAAKGKIATIRDHDFVNDVNPEIDEFDDFL